MTPMVPHNKEMNVEEASLVHVVVNRDGVDSTKKKWVPFPWVNRWARSDDHPPL